MNTCRNVFLTNNLTVLSVGINTEMKMAASRRFCALRKTFAVRSNSNLCSQAIQNVVLSSQAEEGEIIAAATDGIKYHPTMYYHA